MHQVTDDGKWKDSITFGYGKVVEDLANASEYGETTKEAFFALPILKTITYNDRNVITGFSK